MKVMAIFLNEIKCRIFFRNLIPFVILHKKKFGVKVSFDRKVNVLNILHFILAYTFLFHFDIKYKRSYRLFNF